MVKKISVFIMILGLFFVGIPQPKVKAQDFGSDVDYYYRTTWESSRTVWVPELNKDINTVIDELEGSALFGINNLDIIVRSQASNETLYQGTPEYIYFVPIGDGLLVIDGVLITNEWYPMYTDLFYTITQSSYSEVDGAYQQGIRDGFDNGYNDGYSDGLNETDATGFVGLLTAVFGGLGALLALEILPGIYIGAIIAVPLVFGIIFFILGKRKGD